MYVAYQENAASNELPALVQILEESGASETVPDTSEEIQTATDEVNKNNAIEDSLELTENSRSWELDKLQKELPLNTNQLQVCYTITYIQFDQKLLVARKIYAVANWGGKLYFN